MQDTDSANKTSTKTQYTKREIFSNWFYYHKWYLLIILAILFIVVDIISNYLSTPSPDYKFAYIGGNRIPDDAISAFEKEVAQYGVDVNNDGKVIVQLKQYILATSETSVDALQQLYAADATLTADILDNESHFFILEDPTTFQNSYELLTDKNGDFASSSNDINSFCVLWSNCSTLVQMQLGSYTESFAGITTTGNVYDVFSDLYLAQRGYYHDIPEEIADYHNLWNTLTGN